MSVVSRASEDRYHQRHEWFHCLEAVLTMLPNPAQSPLADLRNVVLQRLAGIRRRMRTQFAAEGLARLLGLLVLLCATTLLVDWWLEISFAARLCCWGVIVGLTVWVFWYHLLRPLTLSLEPVDIADALDRRTTSRQPIAPRVATVLQLVPQPSPHEEASPELAARAVENSFREFDQIDLHRQLNRRHLWISLAAAVAALLIPVGFAVAFPQPARLWAERWLMGSDRPWPRSTSFELVGIKQGRLIVPRGEPAPLQVLVRDEQHPTETVWMRLTESDGTTSTVSLEKFAAGDFRYELMPRQAAATATIWGGDGRVEPFEIVPMDRPRIVSAALESKHPQESEWQNHSFTTGDGNIRLQPGTAVRLRMTTNIPVQTVQLDREGPGLVSLPTSITLISSQEAGLDWTHTDEVRLRVTLTATESGLISRPHPFVIGRLDDLPPRVAARWSGVRQRVTPQATIPLT
ncbi:MAG: hypothetical protein R3C01_03640, partial [Planctomycetaceae bacterium]